jgi:hypothetical protein
MPLAVGCLIDKKALKERFFVLIFRKHVPYTGFTNHRCVDTPLWRGTIHLLITWIARTIRAVMK